MADSSPIVLVDGTYYFFRSFWTAADMQTSTGEYSGAIRGMAMFLMQLLQDYPDSPIAIVFDTEKPTFRHELFKEYKANRPAMHKEMSQQIQPTHKLVKTMGFMLIKKDGYEADDIIGTLATQASAEQKVVICTADKDMAQLVKGNVVIYDSLKKVHVDAAGVQEKFGVTPELMIDYLALMGDASDNIPGVDKVGPKTAAKWLNQYGSLDNLIEKQHQIKGKVGDNFRAAVGHLSMSRILATIKCDVELDVSIGEITQPKLDVNAITPFFNQYELRTALRLLIERFPEASEDAVEGQDETKFIAEIVTDQATLQRWIQRIKDYGSLALATSCHYTGVDELAGGLTGIAISVHSDRAAYIPIKHHVHVDEGFRQLSEDLVLTHLKPIWEDPNISKIGNDLKPTVKFLLSKGIDLKGALWDTRLMSHLLHSTAPGGHGIAKLASRHLDYTTIDLQTLIGTRGSRIHFQDVKIPESAQYMAELVAVGQRVFAALQEQLESSEKLMKLYHEIELPLMSVLIKIERNGVHLASEPVQALSKELGERITELQKAAHTIVGSAFGLNSPKQLQGILFDQLKLPAPRKTRGGTRSTSEEVLRDLLGMHPLPKIILDYRMATKLKSTYTDQLIHYIHAKTKRVHTTYDQTGASTGRLASTSPNLQNIPIRTPEGRRLRSAFVAEDGNVLMSADYSQIELRIMAHLSGDKSLQDAFNNGLDVHAATASEVFGVSYEDVSLDMRRRAKAINFGLIYGMSIFGLARSLGIERSEAKVFVESYFGHYPGVRAYMDDIRIKARDEGFVETINGRRIYLDAINSSNPVTRAGAERLAINAPMQGSAADIIKKATVLIDQELAKSKLDARMVLHVHDEIVFEVAETEVDELSESVAKIMQNAAKLAVKLEVDTGYGLNWSAAH